MTISRPLPSKFSAESRKALAEKIFHVSSGIRDIRFGDGGTLEVTLENSEAASSVEQKLDRLIQRFAEFDFAPAERILYEAPGHLGAAFQDPTDPLLATGAIVKLGEGQFALTGTALDLLDYFDTSVKEIGNEFGAQEYRYPTIIPIRAMQRIQYLRGRPECLNFVSHLREDIDVIDAFSRDAPGMTDRAEVNGRAETDCLNSVAVCLHAFHQLQDHDLGDRAIRIGAVGKCMRYEAGNMRSLRRLRDFTMREVIAMGTESEILMFRKRAFARMTERLAEWGLASVVATAGDVFFTQAFAEQSVFQKVFDLKYELRARLAPPDDSLAIGSLNDHRDFLGKGFGIMAGGRPAHSSCLAYGLERCVYAFLAQHGMKQSNWPDAVARRLRPAVTTAGGR
jgi:hypothetical protein